ncbi:coiled-coil-helix-coiled-coil-helix domain-containing protein 5 isoform X1 [Zonotrichia albicollis]|uniref:coiled-coil-helix-coiled-coil-helix domain-containing protein 5 isoform X1 n=1 Tax=Zonotrichia albicollis TaxID=44394 RepID=UPI0006B83915|nr:coiled-coil-helix-coiled-coil-helix domain-containing protein 5 isoform X1 [Zonotrichia albicollis]
MEALAVTAQLCGPELERYGRCVAASPGSWHRDCHQLSLSVTECASNHPLVRRIRRDCSDSFGAFERCLRERPRRAAECGPQRIPGIKTHPGMPRKPQNLLESPPKSWELPLWKRSPGMWGLIRNSLRIPGFLSQELEEEIKIPAGSPQESLGWDQKFYFSFQFFSFFPLLFSPSFPAFSPHLFLLFQLFLGSLPVFGVFFGNLVFPRNYSEIGVAVFHGKKNLWEFWKPSQPLGAPKFREFQSHHPPPNS